MPPTRLNDNVLTSTNVLYGYSLYYHTWRSSTRPVLVFFFSSPPSPLIFFPGSRRLQDTWYFCCILIVFFLSCARLKPTCIHHYPPTLVAVFPCPNALYLDEICTHLTPKGYLYPLRALPGYPGMTDTYDACILFSPPYPVSTCFIIHITSDDVRLVTSVLHRRVSAMKIKPD